MVRHNTLQVISIQMHALTLNKHNTLQVIAIQLYNLTMIVNNNLFRKFSAQGLFWDIKK